MTSGIPCRSNSKIYGQELRYNETSLWKPYSEHVLPVPLPLFYQSSTEPRSVGLCVICYLIVINTYFRRASRVAKNED